MPAITKSEFFLNMSDDTLSKDELERYQRQIVLPGFGQEGQEKLRHSSVLVVGVGGLGSVAALYLTAAGIGTVGLVENDTVSLHNLQRQVLYREDEVGKPKIECAVKTLQRLNGNVDIVAHPCFLVPENAREIIDGYDLVLDCTDNFTARYLINDTCLELHKPFIYGSIGDTVGQMAVFNYMPPCSNYRILYPNEKELVARGNVNKGVMGVLPSVIASLQVNEAVKIITGKGKVMKDTLFTIDLATLETRQFRLPVAKSTASPASLQS